MKTLLRFLCFFFFFQAEDGIRDVAVTGVQTCALPILLRILPDAEGLLRFRSIDEAAKALAAAESDYERHGRAARALVEEHFDARRVEIGRASCRERV